MGVVQQRGEDEDPIEVRILGFQGHDLGGEEELVIDLDEWSEAGRTALRERLELLGVPHAWEDASLVIKPDDDLWVGRVIEQVEDELAVALDPDAEQIAYDLGGWDDQNRAMLVTALEDETIAYGIDGDELVVHEIDERRVDELVDAIIEPDAPRTGGREADPSVMGDLFVAADRLVHDPDDPEGRLSLIAGAEVASASAPPYGMDTGWWTDTTTACDALIDRLGEEPLDHEAAIEQATLLRDRLRPFV
jgi:hypothetical protein